MGGCGARVERNKRPLQCGQLRCLSDPIRPATDRTGSARVALHARTNNLAHVQAVTRAVFPAAGTRQSSKIYYILYARITSPRIQKINNQNLCFSFMKFETVSTYFQTRAMRGDESSTAPLSLPRSKLTTPRMARVSANRLIPSRVHERE